MEDLNENILDDNPLDVGADMTSQTGGIQTEEKLNTPAGELDGGDGHSFGDHAQEAVLGVGRGVLGFGQSLYELADFVTGDQFLPDINMRKWAGESKTMTGSMVEGITQFLTGFVPVAGQLGKAAQLGRAAGGLSKFGKFAKITKAAQQGQKAGLNWKGDMIAGTVADFISFDAHENRLSNILVEYPELSNPVTEFLKADPDDHELMGRLKNSIEGALTDVAITVAMKGGFLKALDVIKQGKKEVPEGVDPLSVIDISKIDTDAAEIGRVGQENFKSKVFEGDGSTRAESEGVIEPSARLSEIDDEIAQQELRMESADPVEAEEAMSAMGKLEDEARIIKEQDELRADPWIAEVDGKGVKRPPFKPITEFSDSAIDKHRGADKIIDRLNKEVLNPDTKISQRSVDLVKEYLDIVGTEAFDDVAITFTKRMGSKGLFDFTKSVAEVGKKVWNSDNPEIIFHELSHAASRALNKGDRKKIFKSFEKERAQFIKENPWFDAFLDMGAGTPRNARNNAEAFPKMDGIKDPSPLDINRDINHAYKNITRRTMRRKYTPEEVARFETRVGEKDAKKIFPDGEGYPEIEDMDEHYRFVDVDEWFAENLMERTLKEAEGRLDGSIKPDKDVEGILGGISQFAKSIINKLKEKLGLKQEDVIGDVLDKFKKRQRGKVLTKDPIRDISEYENYPDFVRVQSYSDKAKPTKAELKQQSTTKVAKDMADEHFPKEGFKDVKMQQKALKPSLIPNAGAMNSYMRKVYDNLNLSATRKVSVTLEDIKESAKTAFDGLLDDMERLGLPLDQVFRQQVEGKGNDITLDEMLSYTLANRSIQNVFNEQALMIASEFRKVDAADVTKRTEMMATMKSLVSQSVMVDAANSELIASKAGLLLKSQDKNWSGSLKKVGLDADEVKDMVKAKEFIDKVGDSDEKVWENLIDMMDEFSDRVSIEPALVGKMLTKDLLGDGYRFLNRMRMYAMLSGGKTQMSNFFFAMSHHFARRMWQNTGLIFDDPAAAWKLMSNYSSAMFTTDKLTKMAYHKNWWETATSGTSAFEGAGGMKFNDSGFGEGHSWLERKFLSLPTKMMAATDSMAKSKLYMSNLHRKVILDAHKAKITDPDIIKKNFEDVYKATVLDSGRLNNPYNYQKDAIAKKKASGDWDKMSPTERTIFKNQSISSSRRKLKGVEDADKMQQEAIFQSDKTLHMQTPDKKSIEGRVLNAINAFPASELVIPFKKTPINVITSGLSFAFAPLKGGLALASNLTPKGSLGKQKDFLLRELTSKDPLVKAEAKGKIAASASIWTTMLMLIEDKNDMITGGGPSDYNELRRLEETGWQKYSIKVGGKYYSYQKTDPVATLLGLASDLRDGVRNPSVDSNNLAMAYSAVFMTAIHRNVLEKSFLVGVDQFISSLDDENAMAKYITNFGTSFLPAAIPQGGEIISGDSVQTEAWTFMDSVKRRSSGVFDRGSLDPKRNVLGEEMTHTQLDNAIDQGFDMVANVTQDMNDPLLEEIAGLRHGFSIPSHTVAGGIDLREFDQSNGRTAYDYYRRMQSEVKINGRRMRPALERLINSNRYQNISAYSHPDFKTQRIAEIQKIMRRYRSEALEQTFKEFPEINDMYKQSVSLRRRSRSGADIQSQVEELINTYQ